MIKVPSCYIRLCLKIQQPVVFAGAPRAICLFHHVERRCPVAVRPPDDPLLLQLRKLLLGSLQSVVVQPPVLGLDRPALRYQDVLHSVCGLGKYFGGVEDTGELLQHVLERRTAATCLHCGK